MAMAYRRLKTELTKGGHKMPEMRRIEIGPCLGIVLIIAIFAASATILLVSAM